MKYTFNRELETLKLKVMRIAVIARHAVANAYQAMMDKDADLARTVIDGDVEVDHLEVEIDDACLRMLALDQPVAHDLRFVVGSMQVADFMESVADQAVKICKRTLALPEKPMLVYDPLMESLYIHVYEMLDKAIEAYSHEDAGLAEEVYSADCEANSLNNRVLHEASRIMADDPSQVEVQVQKIIMARYLERVGDLAGNAAQSIILIKKGVNPKHSMKKIAEQACERKDLQDLTP